MSTPPRRRRTAEPKRPRGDDRAGRWFPTLVLFVGVVVVGLGIGALAAVYMQRDSRALTAAPSPIALVTSSPQPIAEPSPVSSPEPRRTERAIPTSSASRVPTRPSTPPASPAVATDAPTVSVAVAPTPVSVRTQGGARGFPNAATARPDTPLPSTIPSPIESESSATATAAAPSAATESTYNEHASAVVQRYLNALINGDETTAAAALGGTDGSFSEKAFLDPNARILSTKVTRIDASNASVTCEIVSAKGHFYATYHVTAATSGPYIANHEYIKVR